MVVAVVVIVGAFVVLVVLGVAENTNLVLVLGDFEKTNGLIVPVNFVVGDGILVSMFVFVTASCNEADGLTVVLEVLLFSSLLLWKLLLVGLLT